MNYVYNFKEDGTFINKNRYGIAGKTLDNMFKDRPEPYPVIYSYDQANKAWAKRHDGQKPKNKWFVIHEYQVPEVILVQLKLLHGVT